MTGSTPRAYTALALAATAQRPCHAPIKRPLGKHLERNIARCERLCGSAKDAENDRHFDSNQRNITLEGNRTLCNFSALISHLVNTGKRVFVLLETPSSNIYDPATLMPTGWRRLLARPKMPASPTRSQMEEFVRKIGDKTQRTAEAAGARVINPLDYLCDSEFCPIADKDGHPMYYNYDHLRASYVRDHAAYIDQIFLPVADHANPTEDPLPR